MGRSRPVRSTIASSRRAVRLALPSGPDLDGLADLVGDRPSGVDGPVGDVADQGLLLAVAEPGDGQDGARVGGDGGAEVAVDREPEGQVILRLDVLDLRGRGGHAVGDPDQRVLHVGRQAGDRPAGDARPG